MGDNGIGIFPALWGQRINSGRVTVDHGVWKPDRPGIIDCLTFYHNRTQKRKNEEIALHEGSGCVVLNGYLITFLIYEIVTDCINQDSYKEKQKV